MFSKLAAVLILAVSGSGFAQTTCPTGATACYAPPPYNSVCRYLSNDAANCGSCGHVCPANNTCTNSVCVGVSTTTGGSGGTVNIPIPLPVTVTNPVTPPGTSWANPAYVLTDAGSGGGGGAAWDAGVIVQNPDDFPGQSWSHPAYVDIDGGTTTATIVGPLPLPVTVDGGNVYAAQSGPWSANVFTDGGTVEPTPVGTCVGTANTTLSTDTKIPGTNQTGRRTILIQNQGALNIWCSESASVADNAGILVAPNAAIVVDSSSNVQWYCITSTSQTSALTWSEECAN
jgi:hypothetical protein